ncbi:SDR family oxidoreductase [Paenibacillus sp. 1001270B_150601_E10]|uniref:SDR family oxidoreductase n=1 Tax=Paenibacillus sp. 1001270B_150601_E10 TaxID=2787079 RepID=UPI00189F56AB|nr:SDR family oxidoreductase [Paenibacillus sp. 1001270B_150601_E10]
MIRIASKVVWITGASSGFGKLAASAFARSGCTVIASIRQRDARYQELLREIGEQYASFVHIWELDVRDESEVQATAQRIRDQFGRIDLLINNAGFAAGGYIEDLEMNVWREQFETNVFGLIQATKAVIPYMREARSGCIIQMSSISGRMAFPALGPYVSSKFAVEGFSETLRLELLPYGVDVVLVEPGSYKTSIWGRGLASAEKSDSPNKPFVDRIMEQVSKTGEQAADPMEVVDLLLRIAALPAGKRRLRYKIGKGVTMNLIARAIMPWRLFERLIWKVLGFSMKKR